ncbi:MAG: 3,5-nucleoside bisphosphate phosphatase [Solirubrobacteraceae bacterium]|jgi:predicted metal-dependent phosphoesterase TrpH|nr:3,5-nucleoside bisphosphate phosphatase [Solirubrobacteraceae bacterium]
MSTSTGAPTFDLQCHSTCSDGSLGPADVVAAAATAGVRLLALTDHDTVDGIDEALHAAREHAIELVPAVELSTVDELGEDFHVLGYGIDHTDAALAAHLERWRADRAARIERMAGRLCELGLHPDRSELDARLAAGRPVGRPHLAAAAVSAHRERLEAAGLAEPSAFLEAYLVPGCRAYCRRETPTVPEAIDAIHAAGGIAVWAHPFWDLWLADEVGAALRRFADAGLDGVEAFYVAHDREQTRLLARLADELGLLTTGSADFHGPVHRRFSRFRAFDLHGCEPNLGPIAP